MMVPAPASSILYHVRHFPWLVATPVLMTAVLAVGLISWQFYRNHSLTQDLNRLSQQQEQQLYEAHLQSLEQEKLKSQKAMVEASLEELKSEAGQARLAKLDAIYHQFSALEAKIERNDGAKLDTSSITNNYSQWGTKLLSGQLDEVADALTQANQTLEQQYVEYRASLPKPTAIPASQATKAGSAAGYSRTTVNTSVGSFTVFLVKLPINQYQLKTLTANAENCTNQCPTQPLAQYVTENGAYAGINGSYFCPPDYASCAGKTNSYDFAVYNSNLGKWLNEPARFWTSTGMAVVKDGAVSMYRNSSKFGGGAVSAGISNFPQLLVQDNQVATTPAEHTAHQQAKNTKGALGVDGSHYYLAVINSASLMDAAQVMKTLGARDVLNLDGGGSSALYIAGSYKVGPGRTLPNAVVLVPR